jgi:hypothetical protein
MYPRLLDQRKQVKVKGLQVPDQRNWCNINGVSEADRHFVNKNREYLRTQLMNLAIYIVNIGTSDTYTEEYMILRRVTRQEIS